MSENGQSSKSMFSALKNMEELRRLYDSDTPALAYEFKRRMVEGWTPEHSHHRGQLVALTQGLLIVEREYGVTERCSSVRRCCSLRIRIGQSKRRECAIC
jgi:hypothetical protein